MTFHILQHVPYEGPGEIVSFANKNNVPVRTHRLYEKAYLPDIANMIGQSELLVIMGGPMNIYQDHKYPWLINEKKFLREYISKGGRALGICLGAQLLADALGAEVYANNQKEIGWHLVEISDSAPPELKYTDSFTTFHWHGDTFDLPDGANKIASSKACKNQGFIYNNRIAGLQFHPETNLKSIQELIDNCRKELAPGEFIQTENQILSGISNNADRLFLEKVLKLLMG